ncbi:unnamed protein product [Lactuca virosa]|uniref:Uncharacterized protein n=1 Tax=Lactuca virosa TaxID=75947 RepID=A0AAU9N6I1_9ASTR|nr:unnamed protein product [Lactuca virosa]
MKILDIAEFTSDKYDGPIRHPHLIPPRPSNCLREAIVGSPTTPCDSDDGPEAGVEVTVVFPSSETVHRCAAEPPVAATVTLPRSSPEDSFPLLRLAIAISKDYCVVSMPPAAVRTVVALLFFPSESLLSSPLPSYPVVATPPPSVNSDVAVVR